MTAVATGLMFRPGAEAAARFHAGPVPGLHRTRPESPVLLVEFTAAGSRYRTPNMGRPFRHERSVSIIVKTGDQANCDRIRDGHMGAGGMPVQCGWLGDGHGLSRQIRPARPDDPVVGGTAQQNNRATAARLKQIKIDPAAVQAAFDGVEP